MKKTIKGTNRSHEKDRDLHDHNHEKDHDHKDCLCGSNKCRFRCALCVIVLLVVCIIGEHIYRHHNMTVVAPLAPTQASTSASQTQIAPSTELDVAPAHVSEEGKASESAAQPPVSTPEASTELDVAPANIAENESSVTLAPVSTLEQMLQAPDDAIDELRKKVSILEGEVKRLSALEEKVKRLFVLEEEVKKLSECSYVIAEEVREKWKIWIDLKNKIEKDEDFSVELERFYSAFAWDKELISLMKDFVKGIVVASPKEEEGIIGTCIKYIRKVVKIKKINHAKLFEISGYVLSSLKKQ